MQVDKAKRIDWKMGKVDEVIYGVDGLPRSAKIYHLDHKQTPVISYKPVQKLCPLEVAPGYIDGKFRCVTPKEITAALVEPDAQIPGGVSNFVPIFPQTGSNAHRNGGTNGEQRTPLSQDKGDTVPDDLDSLDAQSGGEVRGTDGDTAPSDSDSDDESIRYMINTGSDTEEDLSEEEFYRQLNSSVRASETQSNSDASGDDTPNSSVSLNETQPDSRANIDDATNSRVSETPETSQNKQTQVQRSRSKSEARDEQIRRQLIRKATRTRVESRKSARSTSN
jgi:hypothetical protein